MAIITCMRLNQWPFLAHQLYLYKTSTPRFIFFLYQKSYMHTQKPLTLIKRNDRHMKIDTQMSMKCVDIIRKKN